MTKLPEWLEAELPEMRPVNYIDFDILTGTFTYKGLDYHTVVEAYDAVGRDDTVDFTPTVRKILGKDSLSDSGILTVNVSPSRGRILLVSTDQKSRDYLEMIYRQWLENDANYQKNPDDFVKAYHWIANHPAFWTRAKDEKTWDWYTNRGTKLYTEVFYHKGKAKVGFETGGHTPGYTGTFHDCDLDVYADSFENAYIALAKRINKFFNPDGTEKEGVRD